MINYLLLHAVFLCLYPALTNFTSGQLLQNSILGKLIFPKKISSEFSTSCLPSFPTCLRLLARRQDSVRAILSACVRRKTLKTVAPKSLHASLNLIIITAASEL